MISQGWQRTDRESEAGAIRNANRPVQHRVLFMHYVPLPEIAWTCRHCVMMIPR